MINRWTSQWLPTWIVYQLIGWSSPIHHASGWTATLAVSQAGWLCIVTTNKRRTQHYKELLEVENVMGWQKLAICLCWMKRAVVWAVSWIDVCRPAPRGDRQPLNVQTPWRYTSISSNELFIKMHMCARTHWTTRISLVPYVDKMKANMKEKDNRRCAMRSEGKLVRQACTGDRALTK